MRQCAKCYTKTEDHIITCPQCGVDLTIDSVRARALQSILESPRANAVYIAAPAKVCPACRKVQGTYAKENETVIPLLPTEGCSCPGGCTCRYEPLVVEVGP